MNFDRLKSLFKDSGCTNLYLKVLAPNDNSKNQVYFGGNFDILNILPLSDIICDQAGDWKKERFKASIDFSWIDEDGLIYPAPKSQLILYPKYPEVRFSGFLSRCQKPPSDLMAQRLAGRLLFFSVAKNGQILGYVCSQESEIAKGFLTETNISEHGVFKVIELSHEASNKERLIYEITCIKKKV